MKMKRLYFLLTAITILLSAISTTCDVSLLDFRVSVINKSAESVKCIVIGKQAYCDDALIAYSPADSDFYSPMSTIASGDTIVELISVHPDDNWDNTYFTFIFFDEKDIECNKDSLMSGVAKCYTLTELKNMDWTLIYKGNENK